MTDDPTDDWEDRIPDAEREWVAVCQFIDHLREYEDLELIDYTRNSLLKDGVPASVADEFLRSDFARFARVTQRNLEAAGVAGCDTPVRIPDDWAQAAEPDAEAIDHDLLELTCRVHDGDGQPELAHV